MLTPQAPIGSGFGAAATAAEVIRGIDLTGKTVVVTGGYLGIGVETVRAFRSVGANVIVPARELTKAKANLAHGRCLLRRLRDRSRTPLRRLVGDEWCASTSDRPRRRRPTLAAERAAHRHSSRLRCPIMQYTAVRKTNLPVFRCAARSRGPTPLRSWGEEKYC
jgi:hypothetical protein